MLPIKVTSFEYIGPTSLRHLSAGGGENRGRNVNLGTKVGGRGLLDIA
jgi:hypothetical protein